MSTVTTTPFDVQRVRQDFPILHEKVHDGRTLVYLDNAATTHKPQSVIDAIADCYRTKNANVHRGVHALSQRATDAFEAARDTIQRYINAAESREIIFVRGTTEAVNLVAGAYGRSTLQPGDEILLSHMEHHSNIVPWQLACEQIGATIKVAPVTDQGEIDLEKLQSLLSERTRIVSIVHVSNAIGTVNPIKRIAEMAHQVGAVMMVDGAQAMPHLEVDVQDLGCDFYGFSGHKMYGPTGIGVLYGRAELLESMPPFQGGGDMIKSVRFEQTTYNDLPHKFEAGTPNIAGVIGLGAAAEYLQQLDLEVAGRYERQLQAYAAEQIGQIEGIRLIGTAADKVASVSFVIDDVHPHDVGTILDNEGIAIRTGHHCTQPLMDRFGVAATARASMSFYNTREEIDCLVGGLHRVLEFFKA